MFDEIYSAAKVASSANKKLVEDTKKKEEEIKKTSSMESLIRKESEHSSWSVSNSVPKKEEVFSEELLDILLSLGCEILEYGKRIDNIDYYHEYAPILEYYTVTKNDYKFIVRNLYDVDIEEGIFAMSELINTRTNEAISYYLDLGCRNTGRAKFDDFILMLSCSSSSEYLDKKYGVYKNIPRLLEGTPYEIVKEGVIYSTDRISGAYEIKVNLSFMRESIIYLIPYNGWYGDTRVTLTNVPKWDVNSSNSTDGIGYYLDESIFTNKDKLVEVIDAFVSHIRGEYGYFEEGEFYKTIDIKKALSKYIRRPDGTYTNAYNYHLIRFENVSGFDGRGYGNIPYINVYNGLEIATHFKFEIDSSDGRYDLNPFINLSDIVFKYDKKIDSDNCILLINNYQYKREDEYENYDEDRDNDTIDSLSTYYDNSFKAGSIEFRGSFTECRDKLLEYIDNMIDIFGIDMEK